MAQNINFSPSIASPNVVKIHKRQLTQWGAELFKESGNNDEISDSSLNTLTSKKRSKHKIESNGKSETSDTSKKRKMHNHSQEDVGACTENNFVTSNGDANSQLTLSKKKKKKQKRNKSGATERNERNNFEEDKSSISLLSNKTFGDVSNNSVTERNHKYWQKSENGKQTQDDNKAQKSKKNEKNRSYSHENVDFLNNTSISSSGDANLQSMSKKMRKRLRKRNKILQMEQEESSNLSTRSCDKNSSWDCSNEISKKRKYKNQHKENNESIEWNSTSEKSKKYSNEVDSSEFVDNNQESVSELKLRDKSNSIDESIRRKKKKKRKKDKDTENTEESFGDCIETGENQDSLHNLNDRNKLNSTSKNQQKENSELIEWNKTIKKSKKFSNEFDSSEFVDNNLESVSEVKFREKSNSSDESIRRKKKKKKRKKDKVIEKTEESQDDSVRSDENQDSLHIFEDSNNLNSTPPRKKRKIKSAINEFDVSENNEMSAYCENISSESSKKSKRVHTSNNEDDLNSSVSRKKRKKRKIKKDNSDESNGNEFKDLEDSEKFVSSNFGLNISNEFQESNKNSGKNSSSVNSPSKKKRKRKSQCTIDEFQGSENELNGLKDSETNDSITSSKLHNSINKPKKHSILSSEINLNSNTSKKKRKNKLESSYIDFEEETNESIHLRLSESQESTKDLEKSCDSVNKNSPSPRKNRKNKLENEHESEFNGFDNSEVSVSKTSFGFSGHLGKENSKDIYEFFDNDATLSPIKKRQSFSSFQSSSKIDKKLNTATKQGNERVEDVGKFSENMFSQLSEVGIEDDDTVPRNSTDVSGFIDMEPDMNSTVEENQNLVLSRNTSQEINRKQRSEKERKRDSLKKSVRENVSRVTPTHGPQRDIGTRKLHEENSKTPAEENVPEISDIKINRIPPLHERNLKVLKDFEMRRLKAEGIDVKQGRWSLEETTKLKSNWEKLIKELKDYDVKKILLDKGYLVVKRRVVQFLGQGLDTRTLLSIYQKARELYGKEKSGTFTKEEKKKVIELINEHGNKWNKIGESVERRGKSVNDLVRRACTGRGAWDDDEKDRLIAAIRQFVGADNFKSDNEKVYKGLPWVQIANKVKTRNQIQCRQEWLSSSYKVLFTDDEIEQVAGWNEDDSYTLIKTLKKLNVKDHNEIDWYQLAKRFYPVNFFVLRNKFISMRSLVVEYETKTLKEILDLLLNSL